MKSNNLVIMSLIHAASVYVYIFFVVMLMNSMQYIFMEENEIAAALVMLVLFVVSACITGALILGKPILLYLEKKKQEALKMFFMTVGWLVLILAVTIIVWSAI